VGRSGGIPDRPLDWIACRRVLIGVDLPEPLAFVDRNDACRASTRSAARSARGISENTICEMEHPALCRALARARYRVIENARALKPGVAGRGPDSPRASLTAAAMIAAFQPHAIHTRVDPDTTVQTGLIDDCKNVRR
jgi:hypothetical protein